MESESNFDISSYFYRYGKRGKKEEGDEMKGTKSTSAETASSAEQFIISSDSVSSISQKINPYHKSRQPSRVLTKQYFVPRYHSTTYDGSDQSQHHSTMSASLPSDEASLPSGSRLNFDDIMNKARHAMDAPNKR